MGRFAGESFTGFDTDRTMLRISAMNLMLHSITHPKIEYKDSVSKQNDISANMTSFWQIPPFKGTIDAESIHDNLKNVTNTKRQSFCFSPCFCGCLKKGGRCPHRAGWRAVWQFEGASIHPQGDHRKQSTPAVISMPSGVFKPYAAGVSTAVLVFTGTGAGGTDQVWFYDMKADGFSLDDKRSEIAENDIPDIIKRFHDLAREAE